ncbi:MAG: conjugal transfer protein TraX [Eubacterium sp.]|nr:conjugal transfer protein TraX [Eubacterium sp.]
MGPDSISGTNFRVFNRDAIKYIAMFTMLLNHIAHIFLPYGTVLYRVFEYIGYFTMPVMCFFLVEGYDYTRSKVKYGMRLLIFAVMSQIPFSLAFHYGRLNMIYTLLCCFLILTAMERIANPFLKTFTGVLLMLATMVSDWALFAPVCTILLYNGKGNPRKTAFGYGVVYVLFVVNNLDSYLYGAQGIQVVYAVVRALCSGLGIIVAAVTVLLFYNGKRAEKGRNFSKWFFYLFYPAHLMILYFIQVCVAG